MVSVRSVFPRRAAVFQSATPADCTSRRSSSVVGACAARACVRAGAATHAAKGEEKCAGQRETEVRNKKEAACVLQDWNTERRYCSCGRATTPATLNFSFLQKETPGLYPCPCKEGSAGACACTNCCASAGGGAWR